MREGSRRRTRAGWSARSRYVGAIALLLLLVLPAAGAQDAPPPKAAFSLSPQQSDPGQDVTASAFPASKAYPPCAPIERYAWDWDADGVFEDDRAANETGFISVRKLEEDGIYPVTLEVTDACGQTARATVNLTVGAPVKRWRWELVLDNAPAFLRAAWLVVWMSAVAIAVGLPLGIIVGLSRISSLPPLRWAAAVYIEFLRGTPLLVQIFIVWLALPTVNPALTFTPLVAGLIALVINTSAYQAEIVRAGIQAIPSGQQEAALAMGFSRWQAMRHVVLPQALRLVIPPLTNEYVILIKDTSLLSTIGVLELMLTARIIGNKHFAIAEPLFAVALLYFVLTFALSQMARVAERRLAIPGLGITTGGPGK